MQKAHVIKVLKEKNQYHIEEFTMYIYFPASYQLPTHPFTKLKDSLTHAHLAPCTQIKSPSLSTLFDPHGYCAKLPLVKNKFCLQQYTWKKK